MKEERIKVNMKINYIKTIGFRKFKGIFETSLYDVTSISGKNHSGKSNILYAIVYIMLGTNLSGDEKACLINRKCDASYGELHFTDNHGTKHILIRGKNRVGTKNTFLTLDGKPVTQNELISFYKDKKLFLSIISPLYFLSKKPAEQKELVDKYLSDIRPNEVFNSLNKHERQHLITRYYKGEKSFNELEISEQAEFINTHILNISMDIAYDSLDKEEQKKLEGIPLDIPSYISELNQDIRKAESNITNLTGKIEYAQNIVNEELPETKTFEKDTELSLAYQELDSLTNDKEMKIKENHKQKITELEQQILDKSVEITELEKKMKDGKKKFLAIKYGTNCICPTCEQNIQDISKNKTIENMKKNLTDAFTKRNVLETQKKDLQSKLMIEKCHYYALGGDTSIDSTKQVANIKHTIKCLEQEQKEIEKFNNEINIKQQNIQNAKKDIDKFNAEILTQNKFINELKDVRKIAQKLYISYIENKMQLAKQYLKDVNVQFYSVLKTTGEIKEDFIITYKGNTLSNLSRSETIATALEFANMFNKIAKTNFPIFIDDMESCADYNFIKEYANNSQLIVSEVRKSQPLKISNFNNKVDYTIIKPVIKGCKTINKYKKKSTIIPQAA